MAEASGAYIKKPSPSSGYALTGVTVRHQFDGDTVTNARVAANGAMDHGVRLDPLEVAIKGQHPTEDVIRQRPTTRPTTSTSR